MAKPSRDAIQNGLNGWDSTVDNNFIRLFDRPPPIFLHTGDESDIESSFPAASHEECIVVVDHTVLGLQLYIVDKNHPSGSGRWVLQAAQDSHAPIVRNSASTLDWDDRRVLSNPAGNITLVLRPAGEVAGKDIVVKNLSLFEVELSAASQIDGAGTFTLVAQQQSVTLYSDGSTYHII